MGGRFESELVVGFSRNTQKEKSLAGVIERQLYPSSSLNKHTLIVTYLGASVKMYRALSATLLAKLQPICPVCQGVCHRHGSKKRTAIEDGQVFVIDLVRVLCRSCGKTHVLLPDFLRPYARYPQPVRQGAVCAPCGAEVARRLDLDPQQVFRWRRRHPRELARGLVHLGAIAAQLDPEHCTSLRDEPPLERLARLCVRIAARLPSPPAYSCLFGLANILLSCWGLRVWL
jgi:hypothetical protein